MTGWWASEARHLTLQVLSAAAIAYLGVRWALLLPDQGGIHGLDSRTYWSAPLDDPYTGPQIGLPGAYLYSPAFIEALTPLRLLPWEVFHGIWMALGIGSLILMVGPIGAAVAFTVLPFVFRDVFVGNIHLMLGAAVVLGLRHPAVWALPILTKITPGVGLFWFIGRRDWRSLMLAMTATAAVSLVSFALAPDLWFQWLARLQGDGDTAGEAYLTITAARVALAAGLATLAGWRGYAWLVPIAVVIALPILWPDSLAILLASFTLLAQRRRDAKLPATSQG